jgi:transglutaminase-like putative cysteine protease
MNIPMNRSTTQRIGSGVLRPPRMLMGWEDWLTFMAALLAFVAVGASIHQANWLRDMPPVIPTLITALVVGMLAARIRIPFYIAHPLGLAVGLATVAIAAQSYAEGAGFADRLEDARLRMLDWWYIVINNEISSDRLPFVVLVHSVCFLAAYISTYVIYRWHNPWLAILPGGGVLLANIALQRGEPVGAFLVFLFAAMILIARLHLQRSQARWKRDGVEYPEFISLSAGQLTLFLVGGLLLAAWLLPSAEQSTRVQGVYDALAQPFTGHSGIFNRLFTNVDNRKGGRLHNFGDFLAIKGNVKLGSRELYQVKSGEAGFLRGTSYDEYTGNGWKTGSRDDTRIQGGDLAASTEAANYLARQPVILQVTVSDGDSSVLSAGVPLGTNVGVTAESPKGFRGDIEELSVRRGLNRGDTYNSVGSKSIATADQLRAAGAQYPDWVSDRYLQLPKDLPRRVGDESRRVAGAANTPYDQAVAIEAYLRGFPYDLAVDVPPAGQDLVDYLLFDLRRGYFDFQATGMTVMLRTLGIPARLAVGYVLDPNEVFETTYIVRKDDAYAWVEVYFPKYGWVPFNPTADRPEGGTGALGTGGGQEIVDPFGPTGLQDLFGLDQSLDADLTAAQEALKAAPTVTGGPPWTLIWSLVGAFAFLAVLGVSGRVAWNWGLGGLEGTTRLWAKSQRFATWASLPGGPAETPREWSRRVGSAVSDEPSARQLAVAFEESRYGRPDFTRSDPGETQSAYRAMRTRLLKRAASRLQPKRER